MRKRLFHKKSAATLATILSGVAFCVLTTSCQTPSVSTTSEIGVDQDPMGGGISSTDIRTVASQLAPSVLGLPEVAGQPDTVRIAMAPMRNSSRFIIDMNLFMKRMRLELNRYSQGRVRFFSQGRGQVTRAAVLEGRNEARVEETLKELGREIAGLDLFQNAATPPKVAVIPVLNSNFVNMNADSFMAMLRSYITSSAGGQVQLLLPGVTEGADYLLTGQFIAESMKTESIVDLSKYIQVVEDRLAEGKSLSVYDDLDSITASGNTANQLIINNRSIGGPSILEQIAANSRLRTPPNVTKRLNIMLAGADSKATAYEKMFTIEKKVDEGLGRADLILSGEVSGLSKRIKGKATDYLLITMQLVDPATNELLWEDGYEIKKKSRAGIVYQ